MEKPLEQRSEHRSGSLSSAVPTGPLPSYIDFPNDPIIPLPGLATNTLMYCFPLPVDYSNLVKLCNRRLNLSGDGTIYLPIYNYALIVLYHMQKACRYEKPGKKHHSHKKDHPYEKVGWVRETGVQIVIPVLSSASLIPRLFVPYIFVDNPISLVIGREHVGFPKMLGKFNLPAAPLQADYFDVSTYGFREFDHKNPQFPDYFPWLNIRKRPDNITAPTGNWTDTNQAWSALKNNFDAKLQDLREPALNMVFLKQFRDIAEPEKACYQAITEAPCRINSLNWGGPLWGTYDITFESVASYPIKEELGLSDRSTTDWAFWIDADLLFDTGTVI